MRIKNVKLYIIVFVGLVGIVSAQQGATQSGKSVEQRLAELEQRQEIFERQLELERSNSEKLRAELVKSQQELKELKYAQAEQPLKPELPDSLLIEQLVDKRFEENKTNFSSPEWVKNLKISGDFLYRNEWIDDDTKSFERNRHRIRARVGVYGKASEEFGYGFRIASGSNESPTSTNQDLGSSFSSKNLWLDLAYFDYHPVSVDGLNVLGGKIRNPYKRVGNSDLIFDNDVNPEGLAVKYSRSINDNGEIFASAGGYYVQERATEAETSLWGFQGGLNLTLDKDSQRYAVLGAGYYDYGNLQGTTLDSSGNFFGNTTSGGNFASDFDIIQGFGEYGFSVNSIPVKIFGDYVKNIVSSTSKDTAYLAGFAVGNNKKAGDLQFVYNYRDVEADSIVGVLAEATFGGGGTDVSGHKLGLEYQLAKNVSLGATYMKAERTRNNNTTDYDVAFFDINLKF